MKVFADEFVNFLKSFICFFLGHRKSAWLQEWWAPGHSTGRVVRVCERCGKNMEERAGI